MNDVNWSVRKALAGAELVARYIGGSHVDRGTGKVNGSAFDRMPKDLDGLSVTRRGVLAVQEAEDRSMIRMVVGGRMRMGSTAVFAELQVERVLTALSEFDQPFMICEDPLPADASGPANPAHALLLGLPFAGTTIGSLKSELVGDRLKRCIVGIFPATPS